MGKTAQGLKARLQQHLGDARRGKQSYLMNWLRSLDRPPIMEVMEWVAADQWEAREKHWIAWAREQGCRLVNATDGGEGLQNPSNETRKKMSLSQVGKKDTDETRARKRLVNTGIGLENAWAAVRGKPLSPAHRAAIGAANRGWISPVATAASAAARRGKPISLETRARMAASQAARRKREQELCPAAAS